MTTICHWFATIRDCSPPFAVFMTTRTRPTIRYSIFAVRYSLFAIRDFQTPDAVYRKNKIFLVALSVFLVVCALRWNCGYVRSQSLGYIVTFDISTCFVYWKLKNRTIKIMNNNSKKSFSHFIYFFVYLINGAEHVFSLNCGSIKGYLSIYLHIGFK